MKRFFGLDIISIDGSKLLYCLDDDDGISDGSDNGCIISIPWVKEVFGKKDGGVFSMDAIDEWSKCKAI